MKQYMPELAAMKIHIAKLADSYVRAITYGTDGRIEREAGYQVWFTLKTLGLLQTWNEGIQYAKNVYVTEAYLHNTLDSFANQKERDTK